MILWSHISENTARTLLGPLKIMYFLQLFLKKRSRSILRNLNKEVKSCTTKNKERQENSVHIRLNSHNRKPIKKI